jgi:hypothetical protein
LSRYDARSRFIPIGGIRYPSSRFARKTMPRCTGSTWKCSPIGTIKGTTTTIAEKMSITPPTIRRKRFRIRRKTSGECTVLVTQSNSPVGTSAKIR